MKNQMSWITLQVTTIHMRINLLWRLLTSRFWNQEVIWLFTRDLSLYNSVSCDQTTETIQDPAGYWYLCKFNLRNNPNDKDKCQLQKDEQGPTPWKTHGELFTTTTTINLCYKLIKFTPHHNLVHNSRVDNTPKQNTEEYHIIIGLDIISDHGVDFKFSTAIPKMSWDKSIPMLKNGFGQKKNWDTCFTFSI